jgi:hypothetical protein
MENFRQIRNRRIRFPGRTRFFNGPIISLPNPSSVKFVLYSEGINGIFLLYLRPSISKRVAVLDWYEPWLLSVEDINLSPFKLSSSRVAPVNLS